MKEQFCTFEIALKLKELGFDEPCLGYYEQTLDSRPLIITNYEEDLYLKAPLWQQAISFLFDKLDFWYPYLRIEIFSDNSGQWIQPKDDGIDELILEFDNIEEAILKAIEIIKNK